MDDVVCGYASHGRRCGCAAVYFQVNVHIGESSSKMNIYVGNLPYSMTEDELRELFSPYGTVTGANIIKDKFSGQSKGFGFVEMSSQAEGEEAVKQLDGSSIKGRALKVNQARARAERPRGPRG